MSFVDDGLKMRVSVRKLLTLPPMERKTSFAKPAVAKKSRALRVRSRRMRAGLYRLLLAKVMQITMRHTRRLRSLVLRCPWSAGSVFTENGERATDNAFQNSAG